jgi:tripartite-type tricarboxylate transporter receptor subunit TctC
MKKSILLAVFALLLPAVAVAQNYPTKPIRLVVGFPPGGGTDIAARLVAPKLAEALGQQVIVDNRPGAASNIGTEHVVKSAPDGYTLLLGTPPVIVNKFLYKQLQFDALRDLAAVSMLYVSPNLMVVHASVPVKTVREFIALAKSRPGQINFSSSGSGTTQHLAGELFNIRAKVRTVHVPYRGTAPSLTALVGGEVSLSYAGVPVLMPFIQSGRLRPLATTGAKRTQLMPELPTIRESGVDMDIVVWYGIFAPAATPRPVIDRLAPALVKLTHAPDMKQRLSDLGAEAVGSTPEEFDRQLKSEVGTWAEVVRVSGARAD